MSVVAPLRQRVIVLDPGHFAGHNRGAAAGYYEGNWMLVYARYLETELKALGWRVYLTRYDGKDLSLTDRGRLAGRIKADMFYSLHSNACSVANVRRVTTFYSVDLPGDATLAKALANAVAGVMGSPHAVISTRASLKHFSKPDPSVKEDYYTVIEVAEETGCPHVILTEHDFHTNPDVCRWLVNRANLQRMAKAEAAIISANVKIGTVPPVVPPPDNRWQGEHVVVRGETLWGIATSHGLPGIRWKGIRLKDNPNSPEELDEHSLQAGTVLLIPKK